jgi:hypothetical protein
VQLCVLPCRVESAIRSGKLQQLSSELRQELAALSARDCSCSSLLQLKKQGLIIDLMHACDVVEGLLGGGSGSAGAVGSDNVPRSPEDWAWAKQLRYYAAQVCFFGAGASGSWYMCLQTQCMHADLHSNSCAC